MLRLFCLCLVTTVGFAQSAWTASRTQVPGSTAIYSVAFGNGRFVVSTNGGPGGAAVSTDGLTWQTAASNSPRNGRIIFIKDRFWGVGDRGVAHSADGLAWTYVTGNPQANAPLNRIASTGKRWITGSTNGNAGPSLYLSTDGTVWTPTAPLPLLEGGARVRFTDVVAFRDRFYADYMVEFPNLSQRNVVASTTDGTAWTILPALVGSRQLFASDDRLMAYGVDVRTKLFVSADGESFAKFPVPHEIVNGGAPYYAGGRIFAGDLLVGTTDGRQWTSIGANDYATMTYSDRPQVHAMAYGNGRYVAAGLWFNAGEALYVLEAPLPPIFRQHPQTRSTVIGDEVTLWGEIANADASTTYQWQRNGVAIPRATEPRYTLDPSVGLDGEFVLVATNSAGTTTSVPARITSLSSGLAGRMTNASVLAATDQSESNFILGFSVGGGMYDGLTILARAVGPSLAAYNVPAPHPDPLLEYHRGAYLMARNEDWGGSATLRDLMAQAGAFPLSSATSTDAALHSTMARRGPNSLNVTGQSAAHGSILAEVYELPDSTLGPRIRNVSVRKRIVAGGRVTLGFYLSGSRARKILVRAIGPELATYGLTGVHPNPRIELHRVGESTPRASNDDWGGGAELTDAMAWARAFALPADSKDSALLVTLAEGPYTAQVTGTGTDAGMVLVEVYEVE